MTLDAWGDFWFFNLLLNIAGYGSIIVPAYFLINYLKKIDYVNTGRRTIWYPLVVKCVYGDDMVSIGEKGEKEQLLGKPSISKEEESFSRKAVKLMCCTIGLQVSYLTWGVLQERIMTRRYGDVVGDDGVVQKEGDQFGNSQFLVFINRVLAWFVVGVYLKMTTQPRHGSPMFKYSYCALSNVMSSWFQYEALKYVSFPTQVLGKACKVIPVMLMGKAVSGNKYSYFEWFTAFLLSVGVSLFLFGTPKSDKASTVSETSMSGLFLMLGYMAFDSFTSNWQGALFKEYSMSPFQMMFGVNTFSMLFTFGSLIQRGDLMASIAFMFSHGEFMFHCVTLSICSAVGQLFIYYTIGQFGAVIFIIIMTTRQAIAILLSCMIYGHPVDVMGFLGILTVFLALGLRINNTYQTKKRKALEEARR